MPDDGGAETSLRTTAGDFPLHDYRLRLAGREWGILHTGAVLSHVDELRFLTEQKERMPYGVALWPAAIALAHEVVARAEAAGDAFRGTRVLELGAGTGLPGIVAASFGARVTQTDRQELALYICRANGERNGAAAITYRQADWTDWSDPARYDLILGSDVLYGPTMHAPLRRIFETSLAPGGRLLLSDPFRGASFRLLEELEAAGWSVTIAKWSISSIGGDEDSAPPRPIGVFDLAPPV